MAIKITKNYKQTAITEVNGVLVARTPSVVAIPLYARVERVAGTKSTLTAYVSFYDFAQRHIQLQTDVFNGLAIDLDGANFIAQIYAALKALPEFAGAEDA
jgi:hypothetical protein